MFIWSVGSWLVFTKCETTYLSFVSVVCQKTSRDRERKSVSIIYHSKKEVSFRAKMSTITNGCFRRKIVYTQYIFIYLCMYKIQKPDDTWWQEQWLSQTTQNSILVPWYEWILASSVQSIYNVVAKNVVLCVGLGAFSIQNENRQRCRIVSFCADKSSTYVYIYELI